jgi:hypothetical protein
MPSYFRSRNLLSLLLVLAAGIALAGQAPKPVTGVHVAAPAAACNQTLSDGNDVDDAVAAVANGTTWTICLNNGTYSGAEATFTNLTRTSGVVTIRSLSGRGATIQGSASATITNSDYIKLTSLTLDRIYLAGCSTNITISDSIFVNQALGGIYVGESGSCGAQNIVIDGVDFSTVQITTFGNHGQFGTEGPSNGVTVKNSIFGNLAGSDPGDGIHLGGGTNHVIGPGNTFDVDQDHCAATNGNHCDSIQCFGGCVNATIKQNWFKGGTYYCLMAPDSDSKSGMIYENNICQDSTGQVGAAPIQCGSCVNVTFRHNTVTATLASDQVVSFDSKSGNPASSGILAENNIMLKAGFKTSGGNGCTSCTFDNNMFSVSAHNALGGGCTSCTFTDNITNSPTFTGGTLPTTWAGWLLTGPSPGKGTGNDGQDIGTLYYGPPQ